MYINHFVELKGFPQRKYPMDLKALAIGVTAADFGK
jgi:hypothetical protein